MVINALSYDLLRQGDDSGAKLFLLTWQGEIDFFPFFHLWHLSSLYILLSLKHDLAPQKWMEEVASSTQTVLLLQFYNT